MLAVLRLIGTGASFVGAWALTGWLDDLGFGASAKALVWMVCAAIVIGVWLFDDSARPVRKALYDFRRTRSLMAFVVASLIGAVVFPMLLWMLTLQAPKAVDGANSAPLSADSAGRYLVDGLFRDAAKGVVAAREFEIGIDEGKTLVLGPCPGPECVEVLFGGTKIDKGLALQEFILKGDALQFFASGREWKSGVTLRGRRVFGSLDEVIFRNSAIVITEYVAKGPGRSVQFHCKPGASVELVTPVYTITMSIVGNAGDAIRMGVTVRKHDAKLAKIIDLRRGAEILSAQLDGIGPEAFEAEGKSLKPWIEKWEAQAYAYLAGNVSSDAAEKLRSREHGKKLNPWPSSPEWAAAEAAYNQLAHAVDVLEGIEDKLYGRDPSGIGMRFGPAYRVFDYTPAPPSKTPS